MALSFTHLGRTDSGGDQSSYSTGSLTPTSGRLVLVAVHNDLKTTLGTPTLSGTNGFNTTWTPITNKAGNTAGSPTSRITVFRGIAASSVAGTVTASFGGTDQSGCCIIVDQATNANTTTPVVATNIQMATADSASQIALTMNALASALNGVYCVVSRDANATIDELNSFIELSDNGHGTPTARLESMYKINATNPGGSQGSGNSNWIGIAIEVNEVSVGGGTTYELNVSGTQASSGTLNKIAAKPLAGVQSAVGVMVRAVATMVSGVQASVGAFTQTTGKGLSGTQASSGVLDALRTIIAAFSGTQETTGALTKYAQQYNSGTQTSSGDVGTGLSLGAAGEQTSSGSLTAAVAKVVAGTQASIGAFDALLVILRSFAGSQESAGALTALVDKGVIGVQATAGALTPQSQKGLAGVQASTGVLGWAVAIARSGVQVSTGLLRKFLPRSFSGIQSSIGSLVTAIVELFQTPKITATGTIRTTLDATGTQRTTLSADGQLAQDE